MKRVGSCGCCMFFVHSLIVEDHDLMNRDRAMELLCEVHGSGRVVQCAFRRRLLHTQHRLVGVSRILISNAYLLGLDKAVRVSRRVA